jgi:hypothetical protein
MSSRFDAQSGGGLSDFSAFVDSQIGCLVGDVARAGTRARAATWRPGLAFRAWRIRVSRYPAMPVGLGEKCMVLLFSGYRRDGLTIAPI